MAVEAPNISGQPTMLVDQQPNLTGPRSHRAMAELDVLVASIQEWSARNGRCGDVCRCWVVMVMHEQTSSVHTRASWVCSLAASVSDPKLGRMR
jgi:hypothetical protein